MADETPKKVTKDGIMGAIALVLVILMMAAQGGYWLYNRHPSDARTQLYQVGKQYRPMLATTYADAWQDGRKILDAGQPVDMALKSVADAWDANRKAAFAKMVKPELAKILPEGADPTPSQRANLSKAWGDFADGLRK